MTDPILIYRELIAELKAEIERLREKVATLQSIIDKQLY